jgi:hypothetical protein
MRFDESITSHKTQMERKTLFSSFSPICTTPCLELSPNLSQTWIDWTCKTDTTVKPLLNSKSSWKISGQSLKHSQRTTTLLVRWNWFAMPYERWIRTSHRQTLTQLRKWSAVRHQAQQNWRSISTLSKIRRLIREARRLFSQHRPKSRPCPMQWCGLKSQCPHDASH